VTIELKPEQERIIQEQLATGRFRSVDEVLDTALSKLHQEEREPRESRSEAVRRMIHFAETQSVKLPPGEKVKDLVHEGHRY
jgi:Arc/MetJ-type ribon-helix-helix transcriptional regulator